MDINKLKEKIDEAENLINTIIDNNNKLFKFVEKEMKESEKEIEKLDGSIEDLYFRGMRDAYETILNFKHLNIKEDKNERRTDEI